MNLFVVWKMNTHIIYVYISYLNILVVEDESYYLGS